MEKQYAIYFAFYIYLIWIEYLKISKCSYEE